MSTENINSNSVTADSNKFKSWIPVILSIIVGLVLLVAALPKAFEIDLFIRQIRDYEVITDPLLIIFSAWGLVAFECCLGAALAVNYRPRIAVPLGGILFLIFIAATGYAWATGVTDDCGCFGSWVERSPRAAMLEDILFFAALMVALKWNRSFKTWPFFLKELIVAAMLLTGILLPITAGPLLDRISAAVSGPAEEGSEQFVLEDFSDKDFSTGKHIVIIMSTDCYHCRAEMDNLNAMAEDKGLPEVTALCMNDKVQREEFEFDFEPAFEIYQISDDDFWRLLGDGEIPRTILIKDGTVVKKWDFAAPDIESLRAASGG